MDHEPIKFRSFSEFYPFYLSEHQNKISRALHCLATILVLCLLLFSLTSGNYLLLWLIPIVGYGFAWCGHFFFEKNRPATFRNPLYSLMGDFVMFRDLLMGKFRL